MKKILFSLCIVSTLLSLVGCEPNLPTPPDVPILPTISIQIDKVDIKVGKTCQLLATITPDTAVAVIWTVGDQSIAHVNDSGLVTAVGEGTTTIIASGEGLVSDTCVVNVTALSVITIQVDTVEMYTGTTYQLSATIIPESTSSFVVWNSSNNNVALVSNTGVVTALAEGTAMIIASKMGAISDTCVVRVTEIVESKPFPRKFLIEHFTTEQCGYCPGGMYSIVNHMENTTTPYIWVSHHYGYGSDEYTISENGQIGQVVGVSGAPNMAHNRTKQEVGLAFHPGYLPEITISDEKMSAASIVIEHTFDASTRKLDITVSGEMTIKEDADMLLTVLIKENGLLGKQADYVYSWQTSAWKEFMHTRVVRDVITEALGDVVHIKDKAYSHTLTYTVNEGWNPENCCIVAYLTPLAKQPIINAEQIPLVVGTTGGEQYMPYGITESKGPSNKITFQQVQVNKVKGEKLLEVLLLSNTSVSTAYGNAQPVATIYVHTDATTLNAGTYPIKEDGSMGSIQTGYRIDEKTSFGGSLLLYAVSSYLANGQIAPAHIWRMRGGEMVVDEQGNINLNIKTCSGTTVTGTYTAGGASLLPKLNKTTEWKQYIDLNKGINK